MLGTPGGMVTKATSSRRARSKPLYAASWRPTPARIRSSLREQPHKKPTTRVDSMCGTA
jgi:hypothetical protein